MPQTGDGPFQRGERLTAAKLNDLADGRKLSAAGSARINRDTAGEVIQVDDAEIIFIRLTDKDTTKTPIRYSWKEVVRNTGSSNNTAWLDTTRTALKTDDYAIELNNQDLSVSDGYVYRAERSPHTGEWLFFLRKRRSTGAGTCINYQCTKLPSKIEFDLGPQNPPYSGPSPPLYYQNGHMDYQTMVSGSVCPLRLSTYTNNWGIFQAKAMSLLPYGQRVSITGLNGSGSTASVDLGDVTAQLLPFLPYIAVTSWQGPVFPGKVCPALTNDSYSEIASFKATQYAAVYVASDPYLACAYRMTFTKGIRLELALKCNNKYYSYSTNPNTGQLVTNVQTEITYNRWATSTVGPYVFDSLGTVTSPSGYTFLVTDTAKMDPACGLTGSSFIWGTWAITEWI